MSFPDFYRSRVLQQTYNIPQMIPGGVTVSFQFSITKAAALPANFPSLFAALPSYLYDAETPVAINLPADGSNPPVDSNSFSALASNPHFRAQVTATSP